MRPVLTAGFSSPDTVQNSTAALYEGSQVASSLLFMLSVGSCVSYSVQMLCSFEPPCGKTNNVVSEQV